MTPTMSGQRLARLEHFPSYLDLFTEENSLLRIENDFALERPGHPTLSTTDGRAVEDDMVAYLEGCVGQEVVAMSTDHGRLELRLSGGVVVTVEPSHEYESWEYVGPDGERVVSTPGGELAVWDAQR